MEPIEAGRKVRELLSKYKYALLILAVGVALMSLPGKEKTEQETLAPEPTVQMETMEQHLEAVLSQIDGAGKVSVLLSDKEGAETLYQTDTQSDTDETGSSEQSDTVILTDSDDNETGLVRRTDPPKYLGAVIVCQGADSAQVRLAIVEAVQCATGLGAEQICVVKMK